jgi:dTDP-4-amino-4,6-dideoxygalactose transaminase
MAAPMERIRSCGCSCRCAGISRRRRRTAPCPPPLWRLAVLATLFFGICRPLDGFSFPHGPDMLRQMRNLQQGLITPQDGMDEAMKVLSSGRLFRYSAESAEASQVSRAEVEFATLAGAEYAIAVNSCSSAILIALMLVGVKEGDAVLTNGFTFTAVPSAIMRLGARPVLVESTEGWLMDLDDLERKMEESGAKVLLLSHMRGRIVDMDRIAEIVRKRGGELRLVEDCAHAAGVHWRGRQLGLIAEVSAWSTQSDKVINSGEGGFVTTSLPEAAARAIALSGAYERYYRMHLSRPSEELCESAMKKEPNLSFRMSELTAAVLRPQIHSLPQRVLEYNDRYQTLLRHLRKLPGGNEGTIVVPPQHPHVRPVGDHFNFHLVGEGRAEKFLEGVQRHGVPLKWLRSSDNARWHVNWREYGVPCYHLPNTDRLLANSFDLKLSPGLQDSDLRNIAVILAEQAVI